MNIKKQLVTAIILLNIHTLSYGSSALTRSSRPAMQLAVNNLMNTLSAPTGTFVAQSIPAAISTSYPKYSAATNQFKPTQIQQRSYLTNNRSSIDMDTIPHENDRLNFVQEYLNDFKKDGIQIELSNLDLLKFSNSLLQNCSYQEIKNILAVSKEIALQNNGNKKISLKDLTNGQLISMRETENPESIHIKLNINKENVMQIAFHEAGHAVALAYQSHITLPAFMNIKPYAINKTVISGGSITNRFIYPPETIQSVLEVQPILNDEITTQEMILHLAGVVSEQMFSFFPDFDNEMLTDKSQILSLLANGGARDDMQKVEHMIQQLTQNKQEAQNMLIGFYQATYTFLCNYKKAIKTLAQAALNSKSLTLSEKEIFEILRAPAPLERWEHGPLQEKFKNHYQFRQSPQPNSYGYDAKGNYVGEDGYRDKNGNLQEID